VWGTETTSRRLIICAGCPAGFTFKSSVNGCYKVVIRNLNWTDAGLECRRLHRNAHLLIVNDAQEQSAVARMLNSTNSQCTFHIRSVAKRSLLAFSFLSCNIVTASANSFFSALTLCVGSFDV